MNTMVEQIKGLPISDTTARLIACLRMMQEVYGEASEALERIYGEDVADILINEKLGDGYKALEKGLQECLMLSINQSLGYISLKAI